MRAQAMRVRQVLHGERVLGQTGEAVEIDARAHGDDELVVRQVDGNPPRALHDDHRFFGEVDGHDVGLAHLRVAQ